MTILVLTLCSATHCIVERLPVDLTPLQCQLHGPVIAQMRAAGMNMRLDHVRCSETSEFDA